MNEVLSAFARLPAVSNRIKARKAVNQSTDRGVTTIEMAGSNPFLRITPEEIEAVASLHGFKRKRQRNWVRRTADFVQLVNLQRSQWSADDHYLNFALWPLALGEPPTIAESRFLFRTRGERLGANDLASLFSEIDKLKTLADLRGVERTGRVVGLMTRELRALIR